MFGLLCYPLIIEPHLGQDQSFVWTLGYGLLVILMEYATDRAVRPGTAPRISSGRSGLNIDEIPPPPGTRLALAYSVARLPRPANLMLGVTTVLTTEFPYSLFGWLRWLCIC